MFDAFCLGVVLAVGQGTPADPVLSLPPELPRHVTVPNVAKESPLVAPPLMAPLPSRTVAESPIRSAAVTPATPAVRTMPVSADLPGKATVGDGAPTRIPASLPTMTLPGAPQAMPGRVPGYPVMMQNPAPLATAPTVTTAPAAPGTAAAPAAPCATCAPAAEEPAAEEPKLGWFMQTLDGTPYGAFMKENNLSISGWMAGSYTATNSPTISSLPLTWNDRSNSFLFQQFWLDFSKNVDTESKDIDWGWKVAFLAGSDYRFTVNRGQFHEQLLNSRPDLGEPNGFQQNIYGVDLPIWYASLWLPSIFEGTELQVGRILCPWGYESVMAPVAPLMSRSYAFNWAPPFFHTGVNAKMKFSDTLNGQAMIGTNDVVYDGSQELRFIGTLSKTFNDGNDVVTLGTTLGRGKFNPGRPRPSFPTGTIAALAYEPFGRNNLNVFDLVYTHKVNDELLLGLEAIYGYQYGVPSLATGLPGAGTNFGGANGTASWGSIVNYVHYKWCDKVSSILRIENFYDAEGQRTGFEGLYTAATFGLQIQLTECMMFRPEVRYDVNSYSNPFGQAFYSGAQRQNNLFSAGADLIIKY